MPLRVILEEMGHPQPRTPVTTDNNTTHGIIMNTMVPKASKAMGMRFKWLKCRRVQDQFEFLWWTGHKNRGDYHTKHHPQKHHVKMRGDCFVDVVPQ